MKKLFAILLAIAMMAALAMPTFAATAIDDEGATSAAGKGSGDYTIGVDGKYQAGNAAEAKVSVDIAWEKMSFTYAAGSSEYDAGTHQTTTTDGAWSANKPGITVTNHSNVDVAATFDFAQASTLPAGTTITGKFYDKSGDGEAATYTENTYRSFTLLSGEKPAANSENYTTPTKTIYFGISGDPITESTTLGTITVLIAKTTVVSSQQALESALKAIKSTGGMITLGSNVVLAQDESTSIPELNVSGGMETNPIVIDLNGYTLSGGIVNVKAVDTTTSSYVIIKNGKLEHSLESADNTHAVVMAWVEQSGSGFTASSNVYLENVTVSAEKFYATAAVDGAKIEVSNSTLTGGVPTNDGNATTCANIYGTYVFRGSVTMSGKMGVTSGDVTKVTLKAGGTYTLFGSVNNVTADVTYGHNDVSGNAWLSQIN